MSRVTEPAETTRMPLSTQLFRFVATGGLSAVVDFGLLVLGMNLAGLDHTTAKALSWVAVRTGAMGRIMRRSARNRTLMRASLRSIVRNPAE